MHIDGRTAEQLLAVAKKEEMIKSKRNSEHYYWGERCSGWHLVQSDELSVIQELMPANTQEQKHYHHFSQQFFYILKGAATFELDGKVTEVLQGEGIHIKPKTAHCIKNLASGDLEFLVISQPTTRSDRLNEPYEEDLQINLNNKKFKAISNSNNGEVSSDVIFHYRQNKDIVWATYEGGAILFGTLSGRIAGNELEFTYQHQSKDGEFMTGKCKSVAIRVDDKIRLNEIWEWTCKDYSKGVSVIQEI